MVGEWRGFGLPVFFSPAKAVRPALGFEDELWRTVNALHGFIDVAEYEDVVFGLIFLKHISDAFQEHRRQLSEQACGDPEDPDEYRPARTLWEPLGTRWERLRQEACQATAGRIVHESMDPAERDPLRRSGHAGLVRTPGDIQAME